jgi:steroid delta-isomerase-like uncharacterized protein
MTLEEMKALVQRHDEDVINKQDLSVLERDLAPDFFDHAAAPGAPQGPEGSRLWLSALHRAFPDLRSTIEEAIAEGDKVVVRKVWTGTHQGELMGIAATGKQVRFEGIVIWRIADGQLAERWAAIDRFGLMQQLGVIPAPGGEREK